VQSPSAPKELIRLSDKAFIVLDEREQILLERISLDEDEEEALAFVLEVIVPQVRKRTPCLDKIREITRAR